MGVEIWYRSDTTKYSIWVFEGPEVFYRIGESYPINLRIVDSSGYNGILPVDLITT